MAVRMKKTWATVHFYYGDAEIEATMNYATKKHSLTHGNNDENVTFKNEPIRVSLQRAKCVVAALEYIKKELKQ